MRYRFFALIILGVGELTALAVQAQAPSAVEYNNRGIQAYNAGRHAEAISYFEKSYEGARDNATVRRNLCNAHQARANDLAQENNLIEAARHLNLAIGIDPDNPSPLIQLGSYYLRMNMVQDAIFRLEEAIEIKPGDLNAHELLGEAYYRDNDIPSARAQWDYVLEMDPGRKDLRERYEKAFREESVEYDFNRAGSRHFRISYPRNMPYPIRSRVLNILESAYWDLGRKFGGAYPPAPIQVIVYEADQFSKATQLEGHVGAVYDGKIRIPLTDATGQFLPDDEIKRRLTHEYVHVIVRHLLDEKAPWWVNEGLAETLSRGPDPLDADLLRRALEQGVEFRLADLEAHQLKALRPEALRLAYAQAHAAIGQLWSRFGQQRINQFLAELAAGATPEQALQKIFRRTYLRLEEEVAAALR